MRVLSRAAFLVLNRIESEHMAHGGAENGNLPVTYADFERSGVHPDGIAPAIRELEALGIIETTRKGYGGEAAVHAPSYYRLTYVGACKAGRTDASGTHDYLKFKTADQAEAAAKEARRACDPRVVARAKKHFATPGFRSIPPPKTGGETPNVRPRKPGVLRYPRNPGDLSISRRGTRQQAARCDGPEDTGSSAANASAPKAPAFDLIDGSFRIGDRRIEVRKPAAALSLTAGQLAQQLAASRPSNADTPMRPRRAVVVGARSPAIATE
jgi:hypothetical protein